MADDPRPDLEKVHPRPDQAEEPADDVGASNVDLDEARHGADHVSPAVPESGHEPDDGHGHDDHGDHPVEDPRWVLAPVVVGVLVAVVLLIVVGLSSGADPFHTL
jgi:hypothetical protein